MMRELELSCAQVKHLAINREELTVSWSLPASKNDVKLARCVVGAAYVRE